MIGGLNHENGFWVDSLGFRVMRMDFWAVVP